MEITDRPARGAASLLLALRNNTHSSVSVFQTPHQPLTA